jgi:hypothetical protein
MTKHTNKNNKKQRGGQPVGPVNPSQQDAVAVAPPASTSSGSSWSIPTLSFFSTEKPFYEKFKFWGGKKTRRAKKSKHTKKSKTQKRY